MKKNRGVKFLIMLAIFIMAGIAFIGVGSSAQALPAVEIQGGTYTFSNGTISGHTNAYGGGVSLDDEELRLDITGGKITGNTATSCGGGVYVGNGAVCNMTKGEITNNTATNGGGAYLYSSGSVFTMTGGTISGNTAENGGGVYVEENGRFVFNGGTIKDNTADIGSAIYLSGGKVELNGGTISGTIEGYGDIYYNDCEFTSGYINVMPAYEYGIVIEKVPTHDIPIVLDDPQEGDVVATLYGVSASSTVLSHIKVTNLPSSMELAYSGNDIVLKYKTYTVSFTRNNSSYGSLSTYSVTVPYGTTYTTSSNKFNFSNGTTVTATAASSSTQYTYNFSSWSSNSGTITADKTITATFSRSTRYYTVTLSRNNSDYGTLSTYSVSVPYGTTYSVSGNKLMFSDGAEVTATPASATTTIGYSFSSWSSTSGTITAAKTITANFTTWTRLYTVTLSRNNSSYGTLSSYSVDVPYGTTYSTSGTSITFSGVKTVSATSSTDTSTYCYDFDSWSSTSGTITANKKITANFTRATTIALSITSTNVNRIGISNSQIYAASGDTITFTDSAQSGIYLTVSGKYKTRGTSKATSKGIDYAFTYWSVNGKYLRSGVETVSSTASYRYIYADYITANEDEDGEIKVYFKPSSSITDKQTREEILRFMSANEISVYGGAKYYTSGNTVYFDDGRTVTADEYINLLYWKGWTPISGTITSSITIYANYSKSKFSSDIDPRPGVSKKFSGIGYAKDYPVARAEIPYFFDPKQRDKVKRAD